MANNDSGSSAPSEFVSVTPTASAPLLRIGVKSREAQGSAGSFDLNIDSSVAMGGPVRVERRAGNPGHSIVFQFNAPINTSAPANVVDEAAAAVTSTTTRFANELTVSLAGLADNTSVQRNFYLAACLISAGVVKLRPRH